MEWGIIIGIRLLIPLTILKWPLFGSILAIIADNFDVVILDLLGVTNYTPYNRVDKFLDTYLYLIQGYTVLFWKNIRAKRIGIFLLGYRLIGVMLYEISGLRLLLFVFPNIFLWYYLFYLIYKKLYKKEPFKTVSSLVLVLGILTVGKLFHEYLLHVVQFPIYAFLREHILSKLPFF